MRFTVSSLIILALSTAAIVLSNMRFDQRRRDISDSAHRMICIGVFLVGCFFRLFCLDTLPGGISAEEALVGMQAKALWQTGGFLFDGTLTTQFAQWTGESTGPLLAVITAPFVGIFGMTAWTVRLPLALLSCAAMPAAYALGCRLAGKRAGRWMLVIYALCPYFVLSARLTCGANAAVCLLPVALWAMVKGLERPVYTYIGAILMALMAYAQNMYFFISPAVIAAAALIGVTRQGNKIHAICAAMLGAVVCIPAIMTLWVNLKGLEGFEWLGIVRIPLLSDFDKADSVFDGLTQYNAWWNIRTKAWAVITGGVFQILEHMNISREMLAPSGMGALYIISIPLMLLGGFSLLHHALRGKRPEEKYVPGRILAIAASCITLTALVIYGSVGALDLEGCTSVFDYSSLLVFDALLMTAGMCRMERKNAVGSRILSVLMCVCTVMLGIHLFGDGYSMNTNTYFVGFGEAAAEARKIQENTGAKVNVTCTVYPHIAPSEAAEIMYLYAIDADAQTIEQNGEKEYEVIYAPAIDTPDPEQIYFVLQEDITAWDFGGMDYKEMGDYVLLSSPRD